MNELKKCPFCGGEAAIFATNGVKVLCLTCGAQTDRHVDFVIRAGKSSNAVQQVVDAWNRRVRDDD